MYVQGQSLLSFCHVPQKWGVRYPPLQKVGVHVHPVPPESYAYAQNCVCTYIGVRFNEFSVLHIMRLKYTHLNKEAQLLLGDRATRKHAKDS